MNTRGRQTRKCVVIKASVSRNVIIGRQRCNGGSGGGDGDDDVDDNYKAHNNNNDYTIMLLLYTIQPERRRNALYLYVLS